MLTSGEAVSARFGQSGAVGVDSRLAEGRERQPFWAYLRSQLDRSLVVILVVLVGCSDGGADNDESTSSEAREDLLAYVTDIQASDGHLYQATDDLGHEMDTAKIIQVAESGEFAAVYHWWSDTTQQFTPSLATSDNLLDWEWQVDLAEDASMPTIAPATDGGYVVAWEYDTGPHVGLSYYSTWEELLAGEPAKQFTAERQLSDCAEGTPNIYSASSREVDFGMHYYADCQTDRQARATTDWTTWTAETQPLLDRAVLFQGYRGSIGDRDYIDYEGHGFTFLEAQFVQDDWRSFRILLTDDELGAQDPGFPDAPAVPPSVHVFFFTHGGSSAFTNFTISEVTLDGHRALVMGVFIPHEGAHRDEAGQLIYYRLLD